VAWRDSETKLEWIGKPIKLKSQREIAEKAAKIKLLGGGWSAPSIEQLLTNVNYGHYSPATHSELKSLTPTNDWYWSATPAARSPGDYAWGVLFNDGYSYWHDRDDSGFLRAVRVSQ
jgi:hypothetical protein